MLEIIVVLICFLAFGIFTQLSMNSGKYNKEFAQIEFEEETTNKPVEVENSYINEEDYNLVETQKTSDKNIDDLDNKIN